MPRNLELKARCGSLREVLRTARLLGAREAGLLEQVDRYFDVPFGRLKLREIRGSGAELIYYDRPSTSDITGRWSSYLIYPVGDAKRLRATLSAAWSVRAVVRKRRRLFLLENARIHLDTVDGLGTFLEFEVVQTKGRAQAAAMYRRLCAGFDIRPSDLIGGSYVDMLRPLRRT